MKSFACVMMGIAMIAVVVPVAPVEYALSQSGTFTNHYCNVTQEAHEYPPNIYCDELAGHCNSTTKIHYYKLGECTESTSSGVSCSEYPQIQYRIVPVIENKGWLTATELGLTFLGLVLCGIESIGAGVVMGGTGAVVVGVICGGVFYTITETIPVCDFITCKVDYTGPGTWGPEKTECSDYNTGG